MEKGFENHNMSFVPSFWADTVPTANSYLRKDSHAMWNRDGGSGVSPTWYEGDQWC